MSRLTRKELAALRDEGEYHIGIVTGRTPATWQDVQRGIVRLGEIVRLLCAEAIDGKKKPGRPAKSEASAEDSDAGKQVPPDQSPQE